MANKTWYEWVVEESEPDGEIVDTNAYDYYKSAVSHTGSFGGKIEIALLKCVGDPDTNHDRFYAYLKDGKLPESFEDGLKIPKRFIKEVLDEEVKVKQPH